AELLWRGNHLDASGSALLPNGQRIIKGAPEAFRAAILDRDELGQADLFREAALGFIREHPRAFIGLLIRKWVSFWWFPASAGLKYPVPWLRVYRPFYIVLLVGAILGAILAWRRGGHRVRERLVLLLAMFGSISVAQSLYYVEVRHRWGIEALLGVVVAAVVWWPPLEDVPLTGPWTVPDDAS